MLTQKVKALNSGINKAFECRKNLKKISEEKQYI